MCVCVCVGYLGYLGYLYLGYLGFISVISVWPPPRSIYSPRSRRHAGRMLSELEQRVRNNIARNDQKLSELGLGGMLAPPQAKKPKKPRYCRRCHEVWSAECRSTCIMWDNTRVDRVLRHRPKREDYDAEDAGDEEEEGGSAGDAGGDEYNPNAVKEVSQRTNAGGDVEEPEQNLVEEHEEDSDGEDHADHSEDEDSFSSSGSEDGEEGEGGVLPCMELEEEADGLAERRALLAQAFTLLGRRDASPPEDDAVTVIMRGGMRATLIAERQRNAVFGHASLGTPTVDTTAELLNERALTRRGNYKGTAASCTCK